MKYGFRRKGRFAAIALVGSFLLGTVSPSLAAETAAPQMDPRPTLSGAASEKVESLSKDALAASAVQGATVTPSSDGGGFFKSGKGKAALVILIAATGLTVYSKYHDRVKSVIR